MSSLFPARGRARRAAVLVASMLPVALLGACASAGSSGGADSTASADSSASESPAATEAASRTARIAVTYDGGIKILDALNLEELGDIPLDGFNRLNPAGDERHLMVSTTGGFQVL